MKFFKFRYICTFSAHCGCIKIFALFRSATYVLTSCYTVTLNTYISDGETTSSCTVHSGTVAVNQWLCNAPFPSPISSHSFHHLPHRSSYGKESAPQLPTRLTLNHIRYALISNGDSGCTHSVWQKPHWSNINRHFIRLSTHLLHLISSPLLKSVQLLD